MHAQAWRAACQTHRKHLLPGAPKALTSPQLGRSSGSCQHRHAQLSRTEMTQTGVGTETFQTAFGMCCNI